MYVTLTGSVKDVLFYPSQSIAPHVQGKGFGVVEAGRNVCQRNIFTKNQSKFRSGPGTSAQWVDGARLQMIVFIV